MSQFLMDLAACEQKVPIAERQRRWHLLFLLFLCIVFLVAPAASAQNTSPIQHIVFIIKENRSFDHYFGTFPGAEGATTGVISTGQVLPLTHAPDRMPRDLCHSLDCFVLGADNGRMDKWDLAQQGVTLACNVNGDYLCFTQLTSQDIPNYYAYANAFTLSDHMFSSIRASSYPNHLYTVAAQSGGVIDQPHLASIQAEPGCLSDPGSEVEVIDSRGVVTTPFPCFDFQTLTDSLDTA